MKRTSMISGAVVALALTGFATTMPAEARGGFGPGLAAGVIGGAVIAGAASSAYAYAPGPGYGYGAYDGGYYRSYGYRGSYGPYGAYGTYDESQHGGQPSYSRPY
jgi:hypothetical protein